MYIICQFVLTTRILPAIEGSEINNIPEIMTFMTLQKSRRYETDQRRAPGKQTVLHVRWWVIATRQWRHGSVQMMAHRCQPADHRYPKILQTQTERNAEFRILKINKKHRCCNRCLQRPIIFRIKVNVLCDANRDLQSLLIIQKLVEKLEFNETLQFIRD